MNVEIKNNMQVVRADEGYALTEWQEGNDIKDFNYCTVIFAPLSVDLSKYREIEKEFAEELEELKEEELKEYNEDKLYAKDGEMEN